MAAFAWERMLPPLLPFLAGPSSAGFPPVSTYFPPPPLSLGPLHAAGQLLLLLLLLLLHPLLRHYDLQPIYACASVRVWLGPRVPPPLVRH